ncbi:MAG: hypothetical protein KTR25_09700 [Myxococcales bacterium]|nr:hypothetical protein [Myxococcales bacterium]
MMLVLHHRPPRVSESNDRAALAEGDRHQQQAEGELLDKRETLATGHWGPALVRLTYLMCKEAIWHCLWCGDAGPELTTDLSYDRIAA